MWEGSVGGAPAPRSGSETDDRAVVFDHPGRDELLAVLFAPVETAGVESGPGLRERLADAWDAHAHRPMRPGMVFGYVRRQIESLAEETGSAGPSSAPAWAILHADQVSARWACAGGCRVLRFRAGALEPAADDAKAVATKTVERGGRARPSHPDTKDADGPDGIRSGRARLQRGDAFLLCAAPLQARLDPGPVARNLYNADLDEAVRRIAEEAGLNGAATAAGTTIAAPLAILRFGLPHEGEPELTAAGRASLGNLIAVCNDSLEVFDDAVRQIDDPPFARLFEQMRAARLQARDLLAEAIVSIDGKAPEEGTLSGAAHHLFAQLRGTLGGNQPTVILRELEETEERVRRHFVEALGVKMPHHVEEAIRAALEEILLSHDLLYAMSEAAETPG